MSDKRPLFDRVMDLMDSAATTPSQTQMWANICYDSTCGCRVLYEDGGAVIPKESVGTKTGLLDDSLRDTYILIGGRIPNGCYSTKPGDCAEAA